MAFLILVFQLTGVISEQITNLTFRLVGQLELGTFLGK